MDNRIFNVNGTMDEDLLSVLKLAFKHGNWGKSREVEGWSISKEHGFVLYRYVPSSTYKKTTVINKFLVPLDAESVYPIIEKYLLDEETWNDGVFLRWDEDLEHDGHNVMGWRVYCEDWGHVGEESSAFIAVRPAYMWMGK